MDASNTRQVYYVEGKAVELWENPDFEFGWSEDDLNAAAIGQRWVSLFNMLVISYALRQGESGFE